MIIIKVRKEIEDLWNKCLYSLKQRDRFLEYHSSVFNEDLLLLHELYLKELKDYYEENRFEHGYDLINPQSIKSVSAY